MGAHKIPSHLVTHCYAQRQSASKTIFIPIWNDAQYSGEFKIERSRNLRKRKEPVPQKRTRQKKQVLAIHQLKSIKATIKLDGGAGCYPLFCLPHKRSTELPCREDQAKQPMPLWPHRPSSEALMIFSVFVSLRTPSTTALMFMGFFVIGFVGITL